LLWPFQPSDSLSLSSLCSASSNYEKIRTNARDASTYVKRYRGVLVKSKRAGETICRLLNTLINFQRNIIKKKKVNLQPRLRRPPKFWRPARALRSTAPRAGPDYKRRFSFWRQIYFYASSNGGTLSVPALYHFLENSQFIEASNNCNWMPFVILGDNA
jgi:hypothetical protein